MNQLPDTRAASTKKGKKDNDEFKNNCYFLFSFIKTNRKLNNLIDSFLNEFEQTEEKGNYHYTFSW